MPPKTSDGIIPLRPGLTTLAFDPDAFDVEIRSGGVQLTHWRAMRCPVGMTDRDGTRRSGDDHSGCSNGFQYTRAGSVTALFTGSDNKQDQNDVGLIDGSSVTITTPRTYDDSDAEVQVAPFDRFYLNEEAITVPHWELVEASPTGRDRLSFPVVDVLDVMDSHGKRYGVADYSVVEGQVEWMGASPGYNAELTKGNIYSIRYTYRPFFYVTRIMHQVRVARVETPLESGVLVRMPQQFALKREVVFEKEQRDNLAPDPTSARQVQGPRQGAYSPR
jgi:hypothetical protein